MSCVVCSTLLDGDYFHRESCAHHICVGCVIPLIRAGKMYCIKCPPPQTSTGLSTEGNLVLGYDSEQNQRVADQLRAERQKVCPKGKSYNTQTASFSHTPISHTPISHTPIPFSHR